MGYSFVVFRPRLFTYACILLLTLLTSALAGNSDRNFGGIGIDGKPRADGQIEVKQLVTGGPAHLAGMQIGDIITHIDGKPTRGSDFQHMLQYRLRGHAGTSVVLRVHRSGASRLLTFKLIRRQLIIPKGGKAPVSP
ncbi:MAG: signal protein PDZ [Geobacter sp.]|nr:MAG: signal protein PDZ [Geobacter sp.]